MVLYNDNLYTIVQNTPYLSETLTDLQTNPMLRNTFLHAAS